MDGSGAKAVHWRWRAGRGFDVAVLGEVDGDSGGVPDFVGHFRDAFL